MELHSKERLYVIPIFVSVILILFLVRMLLLIYAPPKKLTDFINRQYNRIISLSERRGDIYDIKGMPLAITVSLRSLYADSKLIKESKKVYISKRLSRILKIPYSKILKKLKSKRRFVWIKRKMSDYEYKQLSELIKRTKGLNTVLESKRSYPNRNLASHVIGFVNIDSKGISGVERFYDRYLRGSKSKYKVRYKRDAKGRMIYEDGKIFEESSSANSIYLTIDSSLQYQIESVLTDAKAYFGAKSITSIVIKPESGEIVALANVPNYDPNNPGKYPVANRRNRAITDIYEPGSTFKIITAAIGLENKLITENTKIWCENGRFNLNGRIIREAEGHHFKWLKVKEIIAKSSNVGTSKIALLIGFDRFFDGLELFGIGKRTGIDLPGEVKGLVRRVRNKIMLATMSFGQGIAVTPIQMAQTYAIIANGGYEVVPHVVNKVSTEKKDLFIVPSNLDKVRILSETVTDKLKEMLRLVVEKGTGVGTNIKGFGVAGKTGTAQKPDLTHGGYYKNKYILSFAGFFPVKKPKYALIVVVDDPERGRYASTVAVPIFRRISNILIQNMAFKERNVNVSKTFKYYTKKTRFNLTKHKKEPNIVPDYTGFTLREVLSKLSGEWKDIFVYGSGVVYRQSPKAGSKYVKGRVLKLYLE